MTTLDVHMDQLRSAVAPFPVVKRLSVSTQFPHGMRIRVTEQVPVAAVVVAGRTIAVAGDGTLLHDVVASPSLPTIPVTVLPGGTRLSDPHALAAVQLLAAAPYQLLAHVSGVQTTAAHGLVASLRNGPSLYFGDTTRLEAKWAAVAVVLAGQGSSSSVYIDVTDPERAAAGAAVPTASTASGTGAAGAGGTGASGAGGTSGTGATGTSGTAGSTAGATSSSTGGG
jgi:cell division protein FtsQ